MDVETGDTRTLSRVALAHLVERVRDWQADVRRAAKEADLDVVTVGADRTKSDIALSEFVSERRLKKTYN